MNNKKVLLNSSNALQQRVKEQQQYVAMSC
jgi:hypothetical protein